jgi:hypothetical protein
MKAAAEIEGRGSEMLSKCEGGRRVTRRACGSVVHESAVTAHASAARKICALLNRGTGGVGRGAATASAISVRGLGWRLLVGRRLLVGDRIARSDGSDRRLMEEPTALAHASPAQEVVAHLGRGRCAGVVHVTAVISHAAAALKVGAKLHAGALDGPRSGIVGRTAAIGSGAIG